MNREKFVAIRMFLNMSQPEFSEFLEISPSNVYMIESGERRVSERVKGKLARKFEVTQEFIDFYDRFRKLS
jgi:transcriptional regulator with XRE-family HTH domain